MQTCNIMGVNIAVTDMDKTLRLVEDNCEAWRGKYICVANVHTTVTAHDDPTYLRVQNGAVMALPDGGPLSRYSRKKGFADADVAAELEKRGFVCDPATAKYKGDRMTAIYLKEEFGGFAIHLLQK